VICFSEKARNLRLTSDPFEVIGIAVMLVMLPDSPAIADGGQQRTWQSKSCGLLGGLKYPPVPGVMTDEGDLRKHKRQKPGIQEL
jgi:hypothetical protein